MNIPEDEEQRNIIDKLANFVGRNGPKFEELTKSKQKDNPKFAFLFGGDHHPYYKWKVGLESTQFEAQKRLAPPAQQQTPLQTPHHAPQYQHPPPPQHQPPPPQHAQPPEPAPKPEFDVDGEFRELLQKLILACTKDNIQNGKGWIVDNSKTEKHFNQVSQFLLHRMLEESLPFQQKLHIVYLINDLLHHARKKEVPLLQSSLAKYVLPIVAVTYNGEASDNQQKLAKVVRIWDTQKFFSIDVLAVLNNCNTLYDSQVDILEKEREVMNKKKKEKEEEEAERIKAEQQKQQQQQQQYNQPPQQQPIGQQQQYQQPYNNQQQNFQQFQQFEQWHRPPPPNNPQFYQQQQQQGGFPSHDQKRFPPPQGADGNYNHPPPVWQQPGDQQQGVQTFDYQHQPPVTFDYEHGARPPADQPPSHDPTIPMAPYHDLPAGLMVPLIKIWDCEYNPIESKDLRLPIPQPPSERLLAAIEAFYSPPSHERPRDSQGWEKNGLFEFYKAKLKYIKEKDRKLNVVHRSPSPPSSRSPSPTSEDDDTPLVKERNMPVRRLSPDKRRSRSRSRSRSKSRSKSKSRSRSRSRSRSKGSRSRSRSPRRSPIKRSPTPPEGFAGFGAPSMETKLGAGNVGHQMLTKMGWGGQGLGKKESGIVDPIKGGEIRDKQDKFKGIGSQVNDPFELFRKNRSYSYGSRAASKKKS